VHILARVTARPQSTVGDSALQKTYSDCCCIKKYNTYGNNDLQFLTSVNRSITNSSRATFCKTHTHTHTHTVRQFKVINKYKDIDRIFVTIYRIIPQILRTGTCIGKSVLCSFFKSKLFKHNKYNDKESYRGYCKVSGDKPKHFIKTYAFIYTNHG